MKILRITQKLLNFSLVKIGKSFNKKFSKEKKKYNSLINSKN